MPKPIKSKNFILPSEIKNNLAARLKEGKDIKSLEFFFKGDDLRGAKQFGETLVSLRRMGVKISHEFSIKQSPTSPPLPLAWSQA